MTAAPRGPRMRHPVSWSTARICARSSALRDVASAPARRTLAAGGSMFSTGPSEVIMARSTTLRSSLMLPGQW